MARYYGLGQTAGFADGLAQGFGLVNEVYNDKEINRLKQEELDATAAYRMAETEAESTYRDQQIGLQTREADLNDLEFGLRETESLATIAGLQADSQVRLINAKTAGTTADAALLGRQNAGLKLQQTQDEISRQQRDEKAAAGIAVFAEQNAQHRINGTFATPDEIQAVDAATKGTNYSITGLSGYSSGAEMARLAEAVSTAATTGDLNNKDLWDVVGSFAARPAGDIVNSESYPFAPRAYDGFEVVSTEVVGLEAHLNDGVGQDPSVGYEGTPTLSGTVMVTLRDPDDPDVTYYYQAPLTPNRVSTDNEPLQIPLKDVVDGIGGYGILQRQMEDISGPPIRAYQKQKLFKDEGSYQVALGKEKDRLYTHVTTYPTNHRLIAGKDNNTLVAKDLNDLAGDNLLQVGRPKRTSYLREAEIGIMETREQFGTNKSLSAILQPFGVASTVDGKTTRVPIKPDDLTDREILILRSVLNADPKNEKRSVPTEKTREILRALMEERGNVTELERTASLGDFFTAVNAADRANKPNLRMGSAPQGGL